MKIVLTKDDVMELICEKYYRNTTYLSSAGRIEPEKDDEIYWEGNPEKKEE